MENICKILKLFICFIYIFILSGCNSKTNTNAVVSPNPGSYPAKSEQTLEIITPTPIGTPYINVAIVESTTTNPSVEPTPTTKIISKSETTPAGTPFINVESNIEVSSIKTTPEPKKVEGILVGSDEYYKFYLNNQKIHSIHWNGKEEDNDTFLYNDYLYFESDKGIYRLRIDKGNIELLIENGTGHFSGSSMTILRVERGTIFYIRHGYTGDSEYRLKIANDTNWAEPKYFGQIDSSNKFCFNDEGEISLVHIIDDKLISISPLAKDPMHVPISYNGYLYFTNYTHIYRVTPEGTGFKCILDAERNIIISKIESEVISYYEIPFEGWLEIIKKQMKIEE